MDIQEGEITQNDDNEKKTRRLHTAHTKAHVITEGERVATRSSDDSSEDLFQVETVSSPAPKPLPRRLDTSEPTKCPANAPAMQITNKPPRASLNELVSHLKRARAVGATGASDTESEAMASDDDDSEMDSESESEASVSDSGSESSGTASSDAGTEESENAETEWKLGGFSDPRIHLIPTGVSQSRLEARLAYVERTAGFLKEFQGAANHMEWYISRAKRNETQTRAICSYYAACVLGTKGRREIHEWYEDAKTQTRDRDEVDWTIMRTKWFAKGVAVDLKNVMGDAEKSTDAAVVEHNVQLLSLMNFAVSGRWLRGDEKRSTESYIAEFKLNYVKLFSEDEWDQKFTTADEVPADDQDVAVPVSAVSKTGASLVVEKQQFQLDDCGIARGIDFDLIMKRGVWADEAMTYLRNVKETSDIEDVDQIIVSRFVRKHGIPWRAGDLEQQMGLVRQAQECLASGRKVDSVPIGLFAPLNEMFKMTSVARFAQCCKSDLRVLLFVIDGRLSSESRTTSTASIITDEVLPALREFRELLSKRHPQTLAKLSQASAAGPSPKRRRLPSSKKSVSSSTSTPASGGEQRSSSSRTHTPQQRVASSEQPPPPEKARRTPRPRLSGPFASLPGVKMGRKMLNTKRKDMPSIETKIRFVDKAVKALDRVFVISDWIDVHTIIFDYYAWKSNLYNRGSQENVLKTLIAARKDGTVASKRHRGGACDLILEASKVISSPKAFGEWHSCDLRVLAWILGSYGGSFVKRQDLIDAVVDNWDESEIADFVKEGGNPVAGEMFLKKKKRNTWKVSGDNATKKKTRSTKKPRRKKRRTERIEMESDSEADFMPSSSAAVIAQKMFQSMLSTANEETRFSILPVVLEKEGALSKALGLRERALHEKMTNASVMARMSFVDAAAQYMEILSPEKRALRIHPVLLQYFSEDLSTGEGDDLTKRNPQGCAPLIASLHENPKRIYELPPTILRVVAWILRGSEANLLSSTLADDLCASVDFLMRAQQPPNSASVLDSVTSSGKPNPKQTTSSSIAESGPTWDTYSEDDGVMLEAGRYRVNQMKLSISYLKTLPQRVMWELVSELPFSRGNRRAVTENTRKAELLIYLVNTLQLTTPPDDQGQDRS